MSSNDARRAALVRRFPWEAPPAANVASANVASASASACASASANADFANTNASASANANANTNASASANANADNGTSDADGPTHKRARRSDDSGDNAATPPTLPYASGRVLANKLHRSMPAASMPLDVVDVRALIPTVGGCTAATKACLRDATPH